MQPSPVVFPIVGTAHYTGHCRVFGGHRRPAHRDRQTRVPPRPGVNPVVNESWSWVFVRVHPLAAAPIVASLMAVSSANLARRRAAVDRTVAAALLPTRCGAPSPPCSPPRSGGTTADDRTRRSGQ
ncbi:tryptophan-rich sensory protein [Rhodococcus sp. NPDC059968]|uniref:tryptophan-rich sensory protein n=1 Tax=Rhodococcus sp. NPDC059968 TaxID=3347017 RepID=UPI003671F4B8